MARPLYASDPIGVELDQSLYALDSTTIDVCLSLFPCAKFTDSHSLGRITPYLENCHVRFEIPAHVSAVWETTEHGDRRIVELPL